MHRLLFVFLVASLMSQPTVAAPKYRIKEIINTGIKLTAQNSVSILAPNDGSYGGKAYQGSGQATAEATRSAFSRHLQKVIVAERKAGETIEQSIAAAMAGGYSHFCDLEILQWEDRATEWSGKRDKIEVKLSLYDTSTGQVVRAAVLEGFSKFWTFGGDHPQDLALAHMRVLVDSFF